MPNWYDVQYRIAGWEHNMKLSAESMIDAIKRVDKVATAGKAEKFPHCPVTILACLLTREDEDNARSSRQAKADTKARS